MKNRLVLFLLILAFQATAQNSVKYKTDVPYLVVLSMDAFRWDYPEKYHTPHLDSIAAHGVKAESLQPAFPSKTFPNHYTMATGLYPQNHGIVQNVFTDPELGNYSLGNRKAVQNARFYGGEPIWVTAEKQGVRSACYYWPGSEAPVKGIYPSAWKAFDASVPFAARADSVVAWLKKPAAQRPHLIMWYIEEPDATSHAFGPDSKETKQTVEEIDQLIGTFMKEINALPIADSINLVFTADHGMAKISEEKAIPLNNFIKDNWILAVQGSNPVFLIQPSSPAFADSIQQALSVAEHLNCWKKSEVPEYLHYGKNERIFDIVCAAKPGWSIYWKKTNYGNGGAHGYDPRVKEMHAIFYATGPAFKNGYLHPVFENVNLYSLFAAILHLEPANNDGKLKNVEDMLLVK